MPEYDGIVKINTKINTKEASSQLLGLENRIAKTADKIASLRSRMDNLRNAKIPTQEYREISNQIERANAKFDKLLEKQMQMQSQGKTSGSAWEKLNAEMDELGNEIKYAKGEMDDLVEKGRAFTIGSNTQEFANLSKNLQYAESDMSALNARHNELLLKQKSNSNEYKKMSDTAKKSFGKIDKSVKKTSGLFSSFASRLKGIALSLLIFNWITKAFNAIVNSIRDGFTNIYNESDIFKSKVDSLKASCDTLKNTFASAFRPLVEIAIPYIQRFVEWLTNAINLLGQFIAALTGQKTYAKAIKQTSDATKEQTEATKEAKKAADSYLSPLDEINKYQSQEQNKNTGVENAETSTSQMFEEIPIDTRVLDFIQKIKDFLKPVLDYANQLKNIFSEGFFDGLGDFQPRLDSIKESIASIKKSLINIFTDPAVKKSMNNYINSFVYMLGQIIGSLASIGLTIGTNIIGGIAKYLEQNTGRIKQYLITMFDIGSEINTIIGDFFSSFAFIFEAFASEYGQQITADIIGIFNEVFMGITEIVAMFSRDFLSLFATPIIEGKEQIKVALLDLLAGFQLLMGFVKQYIADVVEFWNEAYKNVISPIFKDLTEKITVLVKDHLAPAFSQVGDLFRAIGEALSALWNGTLKPFIDWFGKNILPTIVPAIQNILEVTTSAVTIIIDVCNGLIKILTGLIDFITGVFTGDWEKAWNGVKNIFSTIWDSITKIVSSAVDKMKDWLDDLFSLFDKAKDKFGSLSSGSSKKSSFLSGISNIYIPSFSGFSNYGLKDVDIPGYATGQVIPPNMKKHLAILGDNSRETEIVSPVSTMKQAFIEALNESGNNSSKYGNITIPIYIGGNQILEAVISAAQLEEIATGNNPLVIGG